MTAIIGFASIANARLLARNGFPSRYQQFDAELKGDDLHLHNISVDCDLYIASIRGRSDDASCLKFSGLQIPIANRECTGWFFVFIALTMVGSIIRVRLRDRRSTAEFTSRSDGG